jgi:16S rRNA processing protein RimM
MRRMGAEKICLGQVLGAHGVRGLVRVKPYTEEPSGVAAYGPVETEQGKRFEIEALNVVKDAVLCRLDGVSDRDQAEALKGTKLFVPREQLPELVTDDGWYWADLIGLAVRDGSGQQLGEIVGVENFGAGDLIDIKLVRSGETHLLSFTEANVPQVDVKQGFVVIDPPAGWDKESEAHE